MDLLVNFFSSVNLLSSGSILTLNDETISPASKSSDNLIIDIPLLSSPFRSADWIGDAPLYFGNIEKCTLIDDIFGNSSNQDGIIFPYAITTKKSISNDPRVF